MNYEQILEWLRNAITNNNLTAEKLMADIGMENKLRNATDEQRAKLVAAITEALELPPDTPSEDLIKAVQDALKEAEQAAESIVNAEASKLANGEKLKNADGTETDNPVYLYAKDKLKGLRGKQLNSMAEKLKEDPIMISLRSKQADAMVNAKDDDKDKKPESIVMREV